MMKNIVVSRELSKELKDLGFNEPCFGVYGYCDNEDLTSLQEVIENEGFETDLINDQIGEDIAALTYEQAFDWLEKFDIYGHIEIAILGSDEWDYCYQIEYLPFKNHNDKRRCVSFEELESFKCYGGSYTGSWYDKKRAKEECLRKMIELCKNKL